MGPQFALTLNEYKTQIRMSNRKHLLVEGSNDKLLFKRLLGSFHYESASIDIDSAEILRDGDVIFGNREKVEIVCESINQFPWSKKLVGFVDREFREFELNDRLVDKIACHKVSGRLVWSRGHSIENYYFDYSILGQSFDFLSVTEYYNLALQQLKNNFEQSIRLACAASLAGKETDALNLINKSIRWHFFELGQKNVTLNINSWAATLRKEQKLDDSRINLITSRFEYWLSKVAEADFEVVRWMCHGHIGFSFLWAIYSKCVYDVCKREGCANPENQVQQILRSNEGVRFNSCAKQWVEKSLGNQSIYPVEVLNLLGLKPTA